MAQLRYFTHLTVDAKHEEKQEVEIQLIVGVLEGHGHGKHNEGKVKVCRREGVGGMFIIKSGISDLEPDPPENYLWQKYHFRSFKKKCQGLVNFLTFKCQFSGGSVWDTI